MVSGRKFLLSLLTMLSILSLSSKAFCGVQCIDVEGEAAIVNNDVPSARTEAIARAKWAAVEQVTGIEVKAQSVVQNMVLVDDAISKQTRGVISGYNVLNEKDESDTVRVKINACVEPVKAKEAASGMALNNSITVFIPARKPKVVSGRDEYEETNILSETIIGRLAEQGYTVVDAAPGHPADAREIEGAVKSGNSMTVRSLMYKFLSNVMLIGKVDYTVSTAKGQDIGYGLSMPFNNVTVRLAYRIITRDSSGKTVILAAGAESGKGLANSVEDATAAGLKELADKMSPVVIDKIAGYIKGVAKKVRVRVDGIADMSTNFAVKDMLQNLAWVTSVDEKGLGDFIVGYPENVVYLANSISQKGDLRVVDFSQSAITVNYQK